LAYIGNIPAESYASFETETFSVSATANYTLSHAVTNENEIRLVINGVVQQPGSGKAYTASGTTLTLTSATVSGDSMYAVYLGRALQTVNPPNASVGNSQTAPTIITGQTAETSIATDDTILIHDTSASALRKMTRANFVSGIGGTNTPAFLIKQTSVTSLANATRTKINLDTSGIDTDSGLDATNKRWIVPSGKGGKYQLFYQLRYETAADFDDCNVMIYKNGSAITSSWGVNRYYNSFGNAFIADLSVGDYLELFALQSSGGSVNASTSDFGLQTYLGGYKIIE